MNKVTDTVKIGNNFYILETERLQNEISFRVLKQELSKTEPVKEIIVPPISNSIPNLHIALARHFFEGLRKTEDPYKAAEFVETELIEEGNIVVSKEVEFSEFSHPALIELCENKADGCNELLGFLVFKGKQYYKCLEKGLGEAEIEKVIFALHNFIESSKQPIVNIIGELKNTSFIMDDKLVVYFREQNIVIVFICKYNKLGPQLRMTEKLKEKILSELIEE